jgi:hypothetical protein
MPTRFKLSLGAGRGSYPQSRCVRSCKTALRSEPWRWLLMQMVSVTLSPSPPLVQGVGIGLVNYDRRTFTAHARIAMARGVQFVGRQECILKRRRCAGVGCAYPSCSPTASLKCGCSSRRNHSHVWHPACKLKFQAAWMHYAKSAWGTSLSIGLRPRSPGGKHSACAWQSP